MTLSRRTMFVSLAGLLALSGSPVIAGSGLPPGLDTDADGTVDLAEAKKAAETLFDKLDHDHDGTLDSKEVRGRLSKGDFAVADLDKDGTLFERRVPRPGGEAVQGGG
jgi:EF hand